MQQAGEESKCKKIDAESVDWSSGASIPEETKENIGKIMDRGLQRQHYRGARPGTMRSAKRWSTHVFVDLGFCVNQTIFWSFMTAQIKRSSAGL